MCDTAAREKRKENENIRKIPKERSDKAAFSGSGDVWCAHGFAQPSSLAISQRSILGDQRAIISRAELFITDYSYFVVWLCDILPRARVCVCVSVDETALASMKTETVESERESKNSIGC